MLHHKIAYLDRLPPIRGCRHYVDVYYSADCPCTDDGSHTDCAPIYTQPVGRLSHLLPDYTELFTYDVEG